MTVVTSDPTLDDVQLVQRVGAGDRTALAELYGQHAGWLAVRLSHRCSDPDTVDTALQDTFLAVWKQAEDYRPTGEVGAWLWTIAVRRLIDQLRKHPPPRPVADVVPLADVIAHEVPLALGHTELVAAFGSLDPGLQAVMAATALEAALARAAERPRFLADAAPPVDAGRLAANFAGIEAELDAPRPRVAATASRGCSRRWPSRRRPWPSPPGSVPIEPPPRLLPSGCSSWRSSPGPRIPPRRSVRPCS